MIWVLLDAQLLLRPVVTDYDKGNDHDNYRWNNHADDGVCDYCGDPAKVMIEPFGHKPACRPCWEGICYGE